MGEHKRFDIFCERHIGVGIRWQTNSWSAFPILVSVAIMFVTVIIGIGPRRKKEGGKG
jgi:hypothetical protein